MAEIELEQITKRYGDGTEAVKGLNLQIADGELMVLVGPSGCGKTTALRMLAGLEEITSGVVRIGGRIVNHLSPKERDIAMVFQNYALYPHMTVRGNMGFALRLAKVEKAEITSRVSAATATLDLAAHLDRKPANLSGGQRQRVAMGRAIVRNPEAFLMDEPLSNLDAKLRVQMRIEVARLQQRLGTTTVYVTHDQTEALTLGHRVAVLRDGRIQQVDTPQRLYDDPANLFVAGFIGSPPMNLLPGRLTANAVELPFGEVGLSDAYGARLDRNRAGTDVIVGIRPEAFADAAPTGDESGPWRFTTRINVIESMGSELYAYFDVECRVPLPDGLLDPIERGDHAALCPRGNVRQLVARLPTSARVSVRQEATLRLDPRGLRLFDARTGESLLTREHQAPASPNGRYGDPHPSVVHDIGGAAGHSIGEMSP